MSKYTLATMTTAGESNSKQLAQFLDSVNYTIKLSGQGSISATVAIEVSNDQLTWLSEPQALFFLSGIDSVSTGFISYAPWYFVRINVISIIGISSSITATFSG